MKLWFATSFCFLAGVVVLSGQSVLDRKVRIGLEAQSLEDALFQLMDEAGVRLIFNNSQLPDKRVAWPFSESSVGTILQHLLVDTGLTFRVEGRRIVLVKAPPPPRRRTISGYIEDEASGEKLIGAAVTAPHRGSGAVANDYGFFSLTLEEGPVVLHFSYLGYEPRTMAFPFTADTFLTVNLATDLTLEEVVITALDTNIQVKVEQVGVEQIDLRQTALFPKLGGENDLLRTVHLLPGVQTGADGIGGIFVRGGNAGHNLVLIDGAPVYNVNRAGGLLSVFNADIIKRARLIKGAIPARYGGRLASVLDIRTRDGDKSGFSGNAELGLLTAKATLEGPIVKEKSSFLVSGRWSLLNWYLEPTMRNYKERTGEDGSSAYDFYDFNAKLNFALSARDRLFLSYYRGSDRFENYGSQWDSLRLYDPEYDLFWHFRLGQDYRERMQWGNEALVLRWNHLFGNRLFLNTSLVYSDLKVGVNFRETNHFHVYSPASYYSRTLDVGEYQSNIRHFGLKTDFDWMPTTQHYVRFGFTATGNVYRPGVLRFDEAREETLPRPELNSRRIETFETALYIEDTYSLTNYIGFNAGLHAAYLYSEEGGFFSLQPRLSGYWILSPAFSLNGSLSRNTQFQHLLASSSIGLPTEIWVPSTGSSVPPEHSWQYTLGVDVALSRQLAFSVEGYYKTMRDLLSYSEGVTYLQDWEANVTSGTGRARGVEMMLRKEAGPLQGWVSYTLAWTDRQFAQINQGDRYPFKYDRRHNLNTVGVWRLSPVVDLTGSWMMSSGLAFSLPLERFTFQLPGLPGLPVVAYDYGSKNRFRLPYYHRLDLGVNLHFGNRGVRHHLNLGLYNAYNRRNPLYYKLRTGLEVEDGALIETRSFVEVRLLPLLPSFSYSVEF